MQTLGDMLYYFPRRYEDYSQLKPSKVLWYGEQITVIGTIQSVHTRPIRSGSSTLIEAILSDGTGALRLSWFNQPWMANRLKEEMQISVSGTVEQYLGRLVMNQPDWEPVDIEHLHTNRIVPIYSAHGEDHAEVASQPDESSRHVLGARRGGLVARVHPQGRAVDAVGTGLMQVHFPILRISQGCRERLAFDEIFLFANGRTPAEARLETGLKPAASPFRMTGWLRV